MQKSVSISPTLSSSVSPCPEDILDAFDDPQPLHDHSRSTSITTQTATPPQFDTCEDSVMRKRLADNESRFLASRLRVAEKIVEKDRQYRDMLREEQVFRMRQQMASDIDDNNSIMNKYGARSFLIVLVFLFLLLLYHHNLAAQLDLEQYGSETMNAMPRARNL